MLAWFAIVTMPELVWDHYIVDVAPLLVLAAFAASNDVRVVARCVVILTSLPVAGLPFGMSIPAVSSWGVVPSQVWVAIGLTLGVVSI